jgi:hypothetical protein
LGWKFTCKHRGRHQAVRHTKRFPLCIASHPIAAGDTGRVAGNWIRSVAPGAALHSPLEQLSPATVAEHSVTAGAAPVLIGYSPFFFTPIAALQFNICYIPIENMIFHLTPMSFALGSNFVDE